MHVSQSHVRRRLGADAAEVIDWRRPRAICIAAEFSRHDRTAVSLNQRSERIDLVRYRIFDVRGVGHLGTGDLEVRIASSADVEKVVPLIERAVAQA